MFFLHFGFLLSTVQSHHLAQGALQKYVAKGKDLQK